MNLCKSPLSSVCCDCRIHGGQLCHFSKLTFGAHVSVAGINSWGTQGGDEPFTLREKLQVLCYLLISNHHPGGGVYTRLVSQPFLLNLICFIFLICPMCRNCPAVFEVFCQRNCSTCSYRFNVSFGGGELRAFLLSG